MTRDCIGSPFKDKDHNHIITGNLKIIEDNKLRKFFPKVLKYRENRMVDYQKAKESIITTIKSCTQFWCDKHSITTSSFSQWKQAVTSAIDEKTSHLSTKVTIEKLKTHEN